MIGGGAHEGQAERDVHRLVEGESLGGGERLIVIHAQRRVIMRSRPRVEHGVGGKGAASVDAGAPEAFHRRGDDAGVFLAQRTMAVVLAFAVIVHLAVIIHAERAGLTAGAILARTHGNGALLAFYALFVLAAAIHAPIGLRNVLAITALASPPNGPLDLLPEVTAALAASRMLANGEQEAPDLAALLHRLSGIALAIFLPLHFLALASVLGGADRLDDFLALTRNPLVKFAEWGLVTALALHLALGLRLLAIEMLGWRERGAAIVPGALAAAVAVGVLFLLNAS